ncbi:MAG: thiamine pyrophosphate-dependent enzyme, partial [Candidatus Limnocylindrales bacterium]
VPMIAVVGQAPTEFRYREAFQEVELQSVFGPLAKLAIEVPSVDRLAELSYRAARVAVSGRPGPVVLILREDLTHERTNLPPDPLPIQRPRPAPEAKISAEILAATRAAERPIIVVGGGVVSADASAQLVAFAEREQIPVVTAWRRPDAFPNSHALYLGWAGLKSPPNVLERLRAADLLLVIGSRLGEFTSYRYEIPGPSTSLIHVDIDAEHLGAHGAAQIACQADAALFLEAVVRLGESGPPEEQRRARSLRNASDRAEWERMTTPSRGRARPGFVDQQAVAAHLRAGLPKGAITVTDGGNFAGWPARYLRWERPGTFLGPTSGAMGYGLPAALGARLASPNSPVVVFAGDGGFLMTGVELETAVRE